MHKLLADYLFQNRTCPLPGIGSLSIGEKSAYFVLGEKLIYPPSPLITFSTAERSSEDLIIYISMITRTDKASAESSLISFCNDLKQLDAYGEIEVPGAGNFYVDVEGTLVFRQDSFPEAFLPPLTAERVIHPESTHTIIVGDKESNSALMTQYYNEVKPGKKPAWWIAALVILLFAITAIIIYVADGGNSYFGNSQKSKIKEAGSTYSQ